MRGEKVGRTSLNASSVAYRCRVFVVDAALLMEMKHVLKITVDMKPVSDVNYPSTFCRRHRRVNRFSPSRCRCLLILFTASIHKKKRRRQERISSCVKRYYFKSIFMRSSCLHGRRVVRVLCVCLSTSDITLLWIHFRFLGLEIM